MSQEVGLSLLGNSEKRLSERSPERSRYGAAGGRSESSRRLIAVSITALFDFSFCRVNYYNEHCPKAAAWLRQLIAEGMIPNGVVDERSILEIKPHELTGYTQQHFFAGIGGWSLALRLAGWPASRPVRTGSCPCQPFSVAGEGKSESDERHLWPVFRDLITFGDATVTFGEQVAGKLALGWYDGVALDLEGQGYAVGAAVLPACGYGADHERKRLYWVSNPSRKGRKRHKQNHRLSVPTAAPLPESRDSLTHARRLLGGDLQCLLSRDGVSVQMERDAAKGYGNAIVPEVAAQFVRAFLESE